MRHAIARPWEADWNRVASFLIHWMKVAPKSKFDRPRKTFRS